MGLYGLMPLSNPYEQGMSDEEKIRVKNRSDKQQQKVNKQQPPKFLQKPTPSVSTAEALSNIIELFNKSNPKANDKEEPTGGNPNGNLDMDSGNSTPVAKPVAKPKVKAKTAVQKPTVVDDGKTKEWYENLANSSYANDKEYEADMKAYRKTQPKAAADNDGKSKEWYESLANSSYANDKAYEADMKAFRKMQADEIAKNGYYTDSQGVKVYAKAMTDKPKKENNNE